MAGSSACHSERSIVRCGVEESVTLCGGCGSFGCACGALRTTEEWGWPVLPDVIGGFMNIRQEMFVREYLVDLCGAAAARRAGYSPKGAKSRASRLLRDPEIKEAVEAAMEERVRRIEIKQDEVIRELKTVAMAAASDENGAAVKLGSKLRALELLGKHLGIFEGKQNQGLARVEIMEDV